MSSALLDRPMIRAPLTIAYPSTIESVSSTSIPARILSETLKFSKRT